MTLSASRASSLVAATRADLPAGPSGWGLVIGGGIAVLIGIFCVLIAVAARDAERTGEAARGVGNLFSTYFLGIPIAVVGVIVAGIGIFQLVARA